MKLAGRVALVTGAGSGLGREIALAFAREGATVGVNDVRREAAEQVRDEISGLGARSRDFPADVSDSVEVRALFEELEAEWGRLDILVNNAGIVVLSDEVRRRSAELLREQLAGRRPSETLGATRTMTDAQWRRTLSVHLDGTFYCTREALRIMERQGSGKIINMASIAGLMGFAGSPDYSAAKAGIIGLTKAVAREAIVRGIHVNAIAPGFVDTPLLDFLDEAQKRLIELQTPIGRLGRPEEIASLALYLASDESSFFVGQVLSPNGGYWI
ncbi:MAG: beta-ketoacyl-ACP reductase [Candidatus Binatia bacterium]|nr:MAG: beta-ketoacyl-ACP reductase [Candidatus Binatia bacterium]